MPPPIALEREFISCLPQLRRFVSGKLKQDNELEDIIQETLYRALRVNRNKTVDNPVAYLITVSKSVMADHWQRNRTLGADQREATPTEEPVSELLETQFEDSLRIEKLIDIISAMPEMRQRVFIERRIEGRSRQEIADTLGISV